MMPSRLFLLSLVQLCLLLIFVTLPFSSASTVYFTRSETSTAWTLDTAVSSSDSSTSTSSRASPDAVHAFIWTFPTTNEDWLKQQFEAVSDPTSSRYLQHLTFEQIEAVTGPTQVDKDAVKVWMSEAGVGSGNIRDYGHALSVQTTVGVVEQLFNTTVHRFIHQLTNSSANVALDGAHVPTALADKLVSLHGVYDHPVPVRGQLVSHRTPLPVHAPSSSLHTAAAQPTSAAVHSRFHTLQTQQVDTQCAHNYSGNFFFAIAPDAIATAYNYTNRYTDTAKQPTRAGVAGGFTISVSGYSGTYYEAFSQVDLARFRTIAGFSAPFVATTFNNNNAANLASNTAAGVGPTTEATLDIQALFQTSPTSNNSFITVTGSLTLLSSLSAIYAMSSTDRPQVVSYSYGFGYSDYQYYHSTDGPATEQMLLRLAAVGVTVVVSSGDDGTQSAYNRQCSTNLNTQLSAQVTPAAYSTSPMMPQYPASSAYVLSVSETAFLGAMTKNGYNKYFNGSVTNPTMCNNCPAGQGPAFYCQAVLSSENPVSTSNAYGTDDTTTGGGFSYVFSQPSWQSTAVNAYLNTNCIAGNGCSLPSSSYFNKSARAYPDVSAFGGYFPIQCNGTEQTVGGTSVAAPIWAGLIARLNELAIARSGNPLGFVNALFYTMAAQQPNTFHDIATGNNICPQSNTNCVTAVQAGSSSTACKGFTSTVGWDPVTGLGSPNIGNMLVYLSAMLRSNGSSSSSSSSSSPSSSPSSSSRSSTGAVNLLSTAVSASSTPSQPIIVFESSVAVGSSSAVSASSASSAVAATASSSSSATESGAVANSSSSSSSTAVKTGAVLASSSGHNGAAGGASAGSTGLVVLMLVLCTLALW